MISDLTYKIIAYKNVQSHFNMDECVDWALEMMLLGYESPNLHILAGLQKPVIYIEGIDYLKATIRELGLKELEGDDALISYASYYIREISLGRQIKANLYNLCRFYISADLNDLFQDFYLLYWAWDEFDHDQADQYYYPDATWDNIEYITVKTARKWLADNEPLLKNLFV